MFTNISFNDYRCQLENRMPVSHEWAKQERMAYCEHFSALVETKKASKFEKIVSGLVTSIFR